MRNLSFLLLGFFLLTGLINGQHTAVDITAYSNDSHDGATGMIDHYNYTVSYYGDPLYIGDEAGNYSHYWRSWIQFDIKAFNEWTTISKVQLMVYCTGVGNSSHKLDIHHWGGEESPSTCWSKYLSNTNYGKVIWDNIANGTLYVDDNTSLRSGGWRTIDLGQSACYDLEAMIEDGGIFALGLHEEGDNAEPPAIITGKGERRPRLIISLIDHTAPTTPQNVREGQNDLDFLNTTFSLYWNPSQDYEVGISKYKIYEYKNNSLINTWYVGENVTSFERANLTEGFYHYGVDAFNNCNVISTDVGISDGILIDKTKPSTPDVSEIHGIQSNVRTKIENPYFTFLSSDPDGAWSASGVEKYKYYWGTSSSGTPNTIISATEFEPPSVTSPGTWYFKVLSIDKAGNESAVSTFTYIYRPPLQINFLTSPAGLKVIVDNQEKITPYKVEWEPNSTHSVSVNFPQGNQTDTKYVPGYWSDNGTTTHQVSPGTDETYTYYFTTEYKLTMSASQGGNVSPGSDWKSSGSKVKIEAFPSSGYYFDQWRGTGKGSYSGSDKTYTITINNPITQIADFLIMGNISVSAPIAGSNWIVGTQQTVTWTSNISGNVNIKLSTDGGSTFPTNLAINTANDGSEQITVPNNPSGTCKVRIESYNDNNTFGLSSGSFTISTANVPSINVTAPVIGANWTVGAQETVTWTSSNVTGNVNIKLSTDGGSTFPVSLAGDIPNDGSELITVPDYVSGTCRIKVESCSNASVNGLNSGNFSILQAINSTVKLLKPNGGENLIIGDTYEIQWSIPSKYYMTYIYLSTDGGGIYKFIDVVGSSKNTYNWTVPNYYSDQCKIKVWCFSAGDNGEYDVSDELFSIGTIVEPNAATLQATEISQNSATIQGSILAPAGAYYTFTYAYDEVYEATNGKTVPSSMEPQIVSERIENLPPNKTIYFFMNVIFGNNPPLKTNVVSFKTLSATEISLQSPAAGAVWDAGTQQTVTWTSSNVEGNVNIKLSTDGGSTFPIVLAENTANDGSEQITVPNNLSSTCRVKIESFNDNTIYGLNPGSFSITVSNIPVITVNAPASGVKWIMGTPQMVTWTSSNVSGNINIRLSTNGGSTFTTFLKYNTLNDGSELIYVPDLPSANCKILVQSLSNLNIFGESSSFSIVNEPFLDVTSPKAGENWIAGSQATVTWTSYNLTGNINIKISTDGGVTFLQNYLAYNTANDGSEKIVVPISPSDYCRIKIESYNNNSIYSLNPGDFTIQNDVPTITVSAPENGLIWSVTDKRPVVWTSHGVTGKVYIRLSVDGGLTFPTYLSYSTENDGSELTYIPNLQSNNCKIMVQSIESPGIFGVSNGNFSIIPPYVKLLNEPAGMVLNAGDVYKLKWEMTGNVEKIFISYSVDNGQTFKQIAELDTGTTYNWIVPVKISENCKIRISTRIWYGLFFPIYISNKFSIKVPVKPDAVALTATDITENSARIKARITPVTGSFYQFVYFYYEEGEQKWFDTPHRTLSNSTGSIEISENITNLPSNRQVWFYIYVQFLYADTTIASYGPPFLTLKGSSIQVFTPLAEATWTAGSQQTVTWSSSNLSGNINIKLSTDGGSTYLPDNLASNSTNDGNEQITVPNNLSSTCRVRVESVEDNTINSLNPGNFSITGIPVISTSVDSLMNFGKIVVGNSSKSQSYTVSGSNLMANIHITASAGFQVSVDDSTFSNNVTVNQSGGNTTAKVYVRFYPSEEKLYSGYISQISGTTQKNVGVSGTGVMPSSKIALTIRYLNSSLSPLNNAGVKIKYQNSVIDQKVINGYGEFILLNPVYGKYQLEVSSNNLFGGVNATDALKVLLHSVGIEGLSGLNLKAADVNASNSVNATDALKILLRTVGTLTSFEAGDWIFDNPEVVINNSSVTQDVYGLCVGDVNGSYVPNLAKTVASLIYNNEKCVGVNPGSEFQLPLTLMGNQEIGAFTLTLRYPEELARFTGLLQMPEGTVYSTYNGVIKIAWAGLTPLNTGTEGVLLNLSFKPKNLFENGTRFVLELDPAFSEINDPTGNIIYGSMVSVPSVQYNIPEEFKLSQNYPNPFNPSTCIEYQLPVDAEVKLEVYNSLGELVADLVNSKLGAGTHKTEWRSGSLPSGTYLCRFEARGISSHYVKIQKMILLK